MKMNLKKSNNKELIDFNNSPRGQYIISQALTLSSELLEESEPSNSEDMVYLLDLYPLFPSLQHSLQEAKGKLEEAVNKHKEKGDNDA